MPVVFDFTRTTSAHTLRLNTEQTTHNFRGTVHYHFNRVKSNTTVKSKTFCCHPLSYGSARSTLDMHNVVNLGRTGLQEYPIRFSHLATAIPCAATSRQDRSRNQRIYLVCITGSHIVHSVATNGSREVLIMSKCLLRPAGSILFWRSALEKHRMEHKCRDRPP